MLARKLEVSLLRLLWIRSTITCMDRYPFPYNPGGLQLTLPGVVHWTNAMITDCNTLPVTYYCF